ncbi:MAG: hypothetical protein K5819_04815 [Lachnospiraceae bacterium]|nr:hypothetical protein [Lachnospiraceae bacterium]
MPLIEPIKNGEVTGAKSVDNVENKNKSSEKTAANKMEDTKQMFLKLLVAEMKYQNPLEPTDNTEYVKEMANLSQVEALQNVSSDMTSIHADSLVGKYANVSTEDGEVFTGRVESSTVRDGVTYLTVEGKEYKLSEIKGVQDADYYEANLAAQTIDNMLKQLPELNYLTKKDTDSVAAIKNLYDSMNSYQRGFLSKETVTTLNAYVNRIVELNNADKKTESSDKTGDETTNTATSDAQSTAQTTGATDTVGGDTTSADQTAADGDPEDNTQPTA